MANCQACGIEVIGWEKYCRNCGAPAAASVADLVDTHRFNPNAPPAATGNPETTNQLYSSPQIAYNVAQHQVAFPQTAPLLKTLIRRKIFWLLLVLFLSGLTAAGIAIGRDIFRAHSVDQGDTRNDEQDPEVARRELEEGVQNALGFKHGSISDGGFTNVQGIFVNSLMTDDCPAALAKIQAGDVITELNNQAVRNEDELSEVLNSLEVGKDVPVKIYRDGATVATSIKVADRNFPPLMSEVEARDQGFLGIKDSSRRCCIPGTKKWGVEVYELFENGPADLFGLRLGDLITKFDGHPVRTPNEFNRRIRATKPRSKITIEFYRGNTEQKVELILGHRWEEPE